ncbi:hypothetical protein PMI14_02074 [Acidovorax sp. CF316]|uniref:hypothetical protein n=1 Tax=Acidovorax sp. CF316 TaxID=1144317 RepID=UPI00026BDE87|nr:hypothetical protein [Acidovorax sp. CF316]EJE53175.1 hypothetical protein PMI14_02074 [Acidovorax sp. CF316]
MPVVAACRMPRAARRLPIPAAPTTWRLAPLGLAAALALAGCGGSDGPDTTMPPVPGENYRTLGVSVTGLATGQSLVLQNNGSDDFIVSTNGFVQTAASWPLGSTYAVTVKTQPTGQRCTAARNTGTLATANASVLVDCVVLPGERNTLGGTISGVPAGQAVVLRNGSEDLAVQADGSFTFATPLAAGAAYAITVKTRPDGLGCVVRNGAGTVTGAVVDTVAVRCVPEGALADGGWERDQCGVTPDGTALTDMWRVSHATPTSLSIGAGGVSYRNAQCSGPGTPMTGPLAGAFSITDLRSAASASRELVGYWGTYSSRAVSMPRPVVLVRKANHLCLLEDSAAASSYPDVTSLGLAVTAAIAGGKCYTPR